MKEALPGFTNGARVGLVAGIGMYVVATDVTSGIVAGTGEAADPLIDIAKRLSIALRRQAALRAPSAGESVSPDKFKASSDRMRRRFRCLGATALRRHESIC